jgi:hypothetical protein
MKLNKRVDIVDMRRRALLPHVRLGTTVRIAAPEVEVEE